MIKILISILALGIWFYIRKQDQKQNKIVYGISILVMFWLLTFRFACDNFACVNYNFLGGWGTTCGTACSSCAEELKCDSTKPMNLTLGMLKCKDCEITGYDKNCSCCEKFNQQQENCKQCDGCEADWSIRSAIDEAGLTIFGVLLAITFLYYKDYTFEEFLQGIDNINLFGALGGRLAKLENNADKLAKDMQVNLDDDSFRKMMMDLYTEIHNNSKSSFDALHLLVDRIKNEEQKIQNILIKHKNAFVENEFYPKQAFKIKNITQSFSEFVKKDRTNKYINPAILLGKQIMLLINSIISALLKKVDNSKKDRYLKVTFGLGCHGDINSKLLLKGSKIPISNSGEYYTVYDYQTSISCPISIGESDSTSECKEIDRIVLNDIPPKPKGEASNTTTFTINEYGILTVEKVCNLTGNMVSTRIDVNKYIEEK